MSYQIIYGGFTVKTSKGYMLMIENGSNNCYDLDGRRERHTFSLNIFDSPNKLLFENVDEAIKHIDHKYFEDGCAQLSRGKSVENFVKRCFKHTIEIQKLLDNGSLSWQWYDEKYKCHEETPQTEQDVFNFLASRPYPNLSCVPCFFH
jgi:hypothetical protein